jgi:hypothetical protein
MLVSYEKMDLNKKNNQMSIQTVRVRNMELNKIPEMMTDAVILSCTIQCVSGTNVEGWKRVIPEQTFKRLAFNKQHANS